MTHVLPDGKRVVVGTGYSGQGNGLNNPSEQYTPNSGPIPQGTYTIEPQRDNVTGVTQNPKFVSVEIGEMMAVEALLGNIEEEQHAEKGTYRAGDHCGAQAA
jgi:hypothetical protein